MIHMVRVVATHPESHAVDVVFMDGGRPLAGVQVLSPMAGGNVGLADLPSPDVVGDPFNAELSKTRDIFAALMFLNDIPVILGFLFPQIAQCLFADKNRRIDRHASDVYTAIDADGNTEVYHPSGTYLRIGTAPTHEDLTGKDYDKKWKIAKNTTKAVHAHLTVANAGVVKATVNIDPSGNITIANEGSTIWHSKGDIQITSDAHIGLTAPRIDWN